MDLWQQTNWYAIQTKPARENFAVGNIVAAGVECLLPRIRKERSIRGVWQMAVKPLFPCYFFARFCPAQRLDLVRCTRGVLRILSSGRFPIPLEEDAIREIQTRIADDGCIAMKDIPLEPGARVTIEAGPFQGLIGTVEREWEDAKRVTLFLAAIEHARVLVEKRWLSAPIAAA
jgi:transcriptional antiterminator RfaH